MISAADVQIYGPGPGTQLTVTGTSSAAQDLGEGTVRIVIKCAETSCIRFGTATVGAAVTTDFPLEADKDYVFDVSPGTRYFRVIQLSTGGLLTWAKVA